MANNDQNADRKITDLYIEVPFKELIELRSSVEDLTNSCRWATAVALINSLALLLHIALHLII